MLGYNRAWRLTFSRPSFYSVKKIKWLNRYLALETRKRGKCRYSLPKVTLLVSGFGLYNHTVLSLADSFQDFIGWQNNFYRNCLTHRIKEICSFCEEPGCNCLQVFQVRVAEQKSFTSQDGNHGDKENVGVYAQNNKERQGKGNI